MALRNVTILHSLIVVTSFTFLLSTNGCKEKNVIDCVEGSVDTILKNQHMDSETKEQAELVLALWKNGRLDEKPVLVLAELVCAEGEVLPDIAIEYYDENKDIAGFGIKGVHKSSGIQDQIIEEIYPVWAYRDSKHYKEMENAIKSVTKQSCRSKILKSYFVFDMQALPVNARTNNQKKG